MASRAQIPSTGEQPVDAMIARLDDLDGLPVEEHVAVFAGTHAGLRQVLSELDAAPEEAAEAARGPSASSAAARDSARGDDPRRPPGAGSARGSGAGR